MQQREGGAAGALRRRGCVVYSEEGWVGGWGGVGTVSSCVQRCEGGVRAACKWRKGDVQWRMGGFVEALLQCGGVV